jgi:iron complex transport system ATP-binding protein
MAEEFRNPIEGATPQREGAVPFSGSSEKGTAPFTSTDATGATAAGAVDAPGMPKGAAPISQQPEMGTAPYLVAADLGFAYAGGPPVLKGLSVQAGRARLMAILGPNGSGKSTLLRILVGLLQPTAGEVRLGGAALRTFPRGALARLIGYVPQETAAVLGFTVLETVLMGRSPHTGALGFESADDWSAARRALRLTDTESLAGRSLDELSGGERQRVLIARALAQEPELVLLDEPTTFLDIRHQHTIYGLLRRLVREEGKTVVCVSHDLSLAAAYADDLVLLDHGHVAASGSPAEVMRTEVLSPVYETRVEVKVDEATGRPYVLPRPPE